MFCLVSVSRSIKAWACTGTGDVAHRKDGTVRKCVTQWSAEG